MARGIPVVVLVLVLVACGGGSNDRSNHGDDDMRAARSLLAAGDRDGAVRIAERLTTTAWDGDAHALLGEVAKRAGRLDDAFAHYIHAWVAHQRDGSPARSARDAHALAGMWLQQGRLTEARGAASSAVEAATRAGDHRMVVYAQLGLADILRALDDMPGAREAACAAVGAATDDVDRGWASLKEGILDVAIGREQLARTAFAEVLALAGHAAIPRGVQCAAHLNLSWLDRRAGNIAAALAHVDDAERLGREGEQRGEAPLDPVEAHLNRGLALADGGRLAEAARELDLAQAGGPQSEWAWWIAYNRGRVAERMAEPLRAAEAYRASIAAVRALTASAGTFGPDVAAAHRQPYLRLLGIHARAGSALEVLGVIAELDTAALLGSERAPTDPARPQPSPLGAPAPRALRDPPSADAIVAAWSGRRLVVVVSDEQRMWRLALDRDRLAVSDLGDAAAFEAEAKTLIERPDAREAANRLGAILVPPGTTGVVDVLVVGPSALLPLGALRRGDRLVVADTPLARVLGVVPRARRPRGDAGAVVLGDPDGTLPAARSEAIAVGDVLKAAARIGREASSTRLREALGARVLHIAGHSDVGLAGGVLHLADRDVAGAEIAAWPGAPAVVVLASCGAAAARNSAGWGSLAAAFLDAGSEVVVASPWSIVDDDARRVVGELYRRGADRDPVGAVAAMQVALSGELPVRAWASFVALRAPPSVDGPGL